MTNRPYILILLFIIFAQVISNDLHGQVVNDECRFGIYLGLTSDYCSEPLEFTNEGATLSPQEVSNCFFTGASQDVWFSFTPTASAAYVSLSGNLNNPSMAIYRGDCNNLQELACNSEAMGTFTELTVNDLVIGQTYYIRVDARNLQTGRFGLCIRSFFAPPTPESDCTDAVVLCDKSPFQVENLNNVGNLTNEMTGSCVLPGQSGERASVWYVWTCDQPGTLTFTLTPNNPNNDEEDLDFVVYEFPGGLDDCDNRFSVRCMLSGETQGLPSSPCYGPTGLREGETDFEEFAGCNNGSNNFVAPLDMEAGKSYGLIINNFSQSGFGFSIEFGGTGTFLGPEANFEVEAVQAFECDKTISFTNLSNSQTDSIIGYSWNFGNGANPVFSTDFGPIDVVYESFGDKIAAITVETERGCVVSQTLEFFVDPCCQDTSTLAVFAEEAAVLCNGDEDGIVIADGIAGAPEYTFSLDNSSFQPSPLFLGLEAGEYQLTIQDIKGCRDTTTVLVSEPPPIVLDAGPDITVDLGDCFQFDAFVDSFNGIDSISWTPELGFITCTSCLDPEVNAVSTSEYAITILDENGCVATDALNVTVNIVRPLYYPNIINPDNRINRYFNLFSDSKAALGIQTLRIFDRWGNLVYEGSPELNNREDGWDGFFGNQVVTPGVYTWLADVQWIDGVFQSYGDVTVIR